MRKSRVPLKVKLTDEEKARIEICKESTAFAKYCGFFEQPALLTYELLELLTEIKDVLYGAKKVQKAAVLSKCLQRAGQDSKMPKLMLFSTHAESVTPLLHVFENPLVYDVAPCAAVFFEFYSV